MSLTMLGRFLAYIIDPTIVLSFGRTGFAIHSLTFRSGDLDVDLTGRRCLVTGANSGIGFESSCALAGLGAEVILLCRSEERGEHAARKIREETGNRRVSVVQLDVSDLEAVRTAAVELVQKPVDVLIHNAGVLPDRRIESAQGLETTFATHVAGPFLLTALLRPAFEPSAQPARIIWVSSGGMYTRKLHLDDVNWEKRDYDGVAAYAETKRAQVCLAELWAEELGDAAVVSSMHPGWAETPSVKSSLPRFYSLMRPILRTPAEGADTVVWLAASESAAGASGGFYFDRQRRSTHYLPFTRETDAEREALWKLCETVTRSATSRRRHKRA